MRAEDARVVRQMCAWGGHARVTSGDVGRRLSRAGEPTRTGKALWDRRAVWGMLRNPASRGTAAYRLGGERVCGNTQVRTDLLDLAVGRELRELLEHPDRMAVEQSVHGPAMAGQQVRPTPVQLRGPRGARGTERSFPPVPCRTRPTLRWGSRSETCRGVPSRRRSPQASISRRHLRALRWVTQARRCRTSGGLKTTGSCWRLRGRTRSQTGHGRCRVRS
ncbi:MAG: recombinase family protein [Nitrospinae bacterium]|nr:recombinase family protein [Nitrospinota bacterium]